MSVAATADRSQRARRLARPFSAVWPYEPRFLETAAGALHYVDEGPRDAEPLLFLHGNPTWSFHFRAPIAALRDRYRCVALDHLGSGLSDKPREFAYDLASHVANVERLASELGLGRLTLVMHDWGGAIGMGFARRRPELVARLAILNSAAFPSWRVPLRIAACKLPLLGTLAIRGLNAFALAAQRMAVAHPERIDAATRAAYLAPYDRWRDRIAHQRFVADIPLHPFHRSWWELAQTDRALPRFRDRPALIVWGERDWCFTPAFRATWQRRLPQAEVLALADAGHWVLEDAPEATCARLSDFLARSPLA